MILRYFGGVIFSLVALFLPKHWLAYIILPDAAEKGVRKGVRACAYITDDSHTLKGVHWRGNKDLQVSSSRLRAVAEEP